MPGDHEKPKKMRDLPIEEQDELARRRDVRAHLLKANAQLVAALRAWVQDRRPDYKRFNATGHGGHYWEWPTDTLARKLADLGWTADAIKAAQERQETPLDFMSAEELEYVYQRVQDMLQYLQDQPPGTFAEALDIYHKIGDMIRAEVVRKTDHLPEQFPTPQRQVRGTEAASTFTPTNYRAPLFPTEEEPQ